VLKKYHDKKIAIVRISVLVLISTPSYIVHLLPHTECIHLVTYQKFRQMIS